MPDTPSDKPHNPGAADEIGSVLAQLASNLPEGTQKRQLSGPERAAVLMLALGEGHESRVWTMLDDDELRQISVVMSTIGTIEASLVENLLLEFVSRMSASGAIMGNYEATERLLHQYLPPERVGNIMEEIRGPAGRNMWEKLSNVQEEVLANYLKNEYPQTVAVVLGKIGPDHAARVLSILPEELALDVVNRMLRMEAVQKEVLERLEMTLRTEFMSNLSQTRRRDAHEVMAPPADFGAAYRRARRTAKFRYPILKAASRRKWNRRPFWRPTDRSPASLPISKRCSTCRSRFRRCSVGRGWISANCSSSGPAPSSNSTARSVKRSTFTSTTAWSPVAKSCWWKKSSASP